MKVRDVAMTDMQEKRGWHLCDDVGLARYQRWANEARQYIIAQFEENFLDQHVSKDQWPAIVDSIIEVASTEDMNSGDLIHGTCNVLKERGAPDSDAEYIAEEVYRNFPTDV